MERFILDLQEFYEIYHKENVVEIQMAKDYDDQDRSSLQASCVNRDKSIHTSADKDAYPSQKEKSQNFYEELVYEEIDDEDIESTDGV